MDPRIKVPFVLVLVETTLVVLFGVCVRFDTSLQPKSLRLSEDRESRVFNEYYPSEPIFVISTLCLHTVQLAFTLSTERTCRWQMDADLVQGARDVTA